ncbi:MAG: hypothetical protein AABZ60_12735 [Planctomycetota bacterium]
MKSTFNLYLVPEQLPQLSGGQYILKTKNISFQSLQQSAIVSGFDFSRAWNMRFNLSLIFIPLGFWLYIAEVLSFYEDLVMAILIFSFIFLWTGTFRFSVEITPSEVILIRSRLSQIYERKTQDFAKTRFEIWGTGDWGDEGSFPIKHFCEIQYDMKVEGEIIGSPSNAKEINEFLRKEYQRIKDQL